MLCVNITWHSFSFLFGRPFVEQFALCYWAVSCPVLSRLSCLSVLSVMLVYCGQSVALIKMKLSMQVGLGPGHNVLDGDPAPPKWAQPPQFSAHVRCGQRAGWIKMPLGMEVGLGPDDIVLDGAQHPQKGARPPIFGGCLVWPNGRPCQLLLSSFTLVTADRCCDCM